MYSLSQDLGRALAINSQYVDWSDMQPVDAEPMTDVHASGLGSRTGGYQQLLIIPICQGPARASFLMRLWGWWHYGQVADTNRVVWFPLLLAEVACVVGPSSGLQGRLLSEAEHFVSEIELASGTLGQNGMIVNPGGSEPAWCKIDLQGAHKFQFDFKPTQEPAFGNALWMPGSAW